MSNERKPISKSFQFWRAAIVYSIDLAIAITAWTVGFGLEVKSWPALIGIGIVARFVTYVLTRAIAFDDADRKRGAA